MFFGWQIVFVSAIGLCFAQATVVHIGFSSFVLPLSEEFGFSRAAVSLAFTTAELAFMAGLLVFGIMLDRYGVRRILLAATTIFSLLVCAMYFLQASTMHLYIMYALIGFVGSATGPISYSRLVISWFDRNKGLALGLATTGTGVAAIVMPPFLEWVIRVSGWREAYVLLGGINLLVCLPLLYWIVCDTPQEKGLHADGIRAEKTAIDSDAANVPSGYTFHQCLRTSQFWKIAGAFLCTALLTAILTQLVPVLVDAGFTPARAAAMASSLGVAIIVSRLLCGYLMDKFFAPYVAAVFLIAPAFGFVALAVAPNVWSGIFAAFALGLTIGAEFDVIPFLCAQYLGRLAFGRVYGLILALFSLALAIGAYLIGLSFDLFSTYKVALITGAVISPVAVLLILSLGRYPQLPEPEL